MARLKAMSTDTDHSALQPRQLPGRANRKALAFTAEIHRLRRAGYSFEAIRLTLLEVGLVVSRSTVKREAAKRPVATVSESRQMAGHPSAPAPLANAVATESDPRSSREIAEAFM
ncbi:MAG: hypothetical protein AB9M53_06280 [Leptothrix sp. (in: b-proteobacteria)]